MASKTGVNVDQFIRKMAATILTKEQQHEIFSSWEYRVFAPAYRLVRYFSSDFNKMLEQIHRHLSKVYLINTFKEPIFIPFMFFSNKREEENFAYVFRQLEIRLDHFNCPLLNNLSFLSAHKVFDNKIFKLQEIPKFQDSPLEIRKRIKRYQKVSIYDVVSIVIQAIQKVEPKFANNFNSGTLTRNIGDAICAERRPLEIIFADTPEKCWKMYSNPGPDSCMKSGEKRAWDPLSKQQDYWHPALWYLYCPHTIGAFSLNAEKNGVAHRTLCYDLGDKGKFFARVYTSFPGQIEAFKNTLKSMGYKDHCVNQDARTKLYLPEHSFEIPGTMDCNRNERICPLPYFDNVANKITALFNVDTNKFTMNVHGVYKTNTNFKGQVISLGNQNGMLTQHEVGYRDCMHCGNEIRHGDPDVYAVYNQRAYIHSTCLVQMYAQIKKRPQYVYSEATSAQALVLNTNTDNLIPIYEYLTDDYVHGYALNYRAACARAGAYVHIENIDQINMILQYDDLETALRLQGPRLKLIRHVDYSVCHLWLNITISGLLYDILGYHGFIKGNRISTGVSWKIAYERFKNKKQPTKEVKPDKKDIQQIQQSYAWITTTAGGTVTNFGAGAAQNTGPIHPPGPRIPIWTIEDPVAANETLDEDIV